jgi:hypothetical protein
MCALSECLHTIHCLTTEFHFHFHLLSQEHQQTCKRKVILLQRLHIFLVLTKSADILKFLTCFHNIKSAATYISSIIQTTSCKYAL